jgi:hypothetical protein
VAGIEYKTVSHLDTVPLKSKCVYSQVNNMPIATSTTIFIAFSLLTVLMPSRRNGWGEFASRGRQYPVSFLIGLRFFLAVMLLVYSELHWHKTAEVRVGLSWA